MPKFTVFDGIQTLQTPSSKTAEIRDQLDEPEFGMPPRLIVGALTALFGAAAGMLSLMIFFYTWGPEHYISRQWLVFVLIGSVAGFFLRIERPIIREFYRLRLKSSGDEQKLDHQIDAS